jgi:hypothetical protein
MLFSNYRIAWHVAQQKNHMLLHHIKKLLLQSLTFFFVNVQRQYSANRLLYMRKIKV